MAKLGPMAKIGVVHLTWKRHLQEGLSPHKLTLKQFYLLRQLSRRDFLYPADIADMLYCDRPTATVVIRNINKKGWIRSERDPENGKRKRIFLTDKGREKLASIQNQSADGSSFDPLGCFDKDERKTLDKLLNRLLQHLDTLGETDEPEAGTG